MKELSATALKRYLEEVRQAPVLLDVREPWEFEIAHVAGSKLIPLSQLPQRLRELQSDREIVLICHHGVRSHQAGLLLQSHGFQRTVNLRGGIDSWGQRSGFLYAALLPMKLSVAIRRSGLGWRGGYGVCLSALIIMLSAEGWSQGIGLLDLYQLAKENDAALRAAEANYQATLMDYPIARARLLPQINFNTRHSKWDDQKIRGVFFGGGDERGETSREYSYSGDSWSLNLSQTLFNAKHYMQLRKSHSQAERAELRYAAERQNLIIRLAEAYFALLTAEKALKFAEAEKEAVNQQLWQAQERFDVGLAPITDVKEAEAAYDLALAKEIEARNGVDNNKHALAVIINYDVEYIFPLGEELQVRNPQPQNLQSWAQQAMDNNLELLAEQISANIAKQKLNEQRADYLPTLNLFVERKNNETRGGPSPRESYETVYGVELNAPLFSGGSTYYQARKAAQLHRQAMENLELKRRETRRDARQSYLDVVSSARRAEALARARESAETSLQSNRAGFEVGTRTSVDVLLALRELFRARLDYESIRHEYVINSLKLKRASGSLAENNLAEVNGWLNEQSE